MLRNVTITSHAAGAAVILSALSLHAAAIAAPLTGGCTPTKVDYSASSLPDSTTTSSGFVNVPETVVSFTQGGASASCVIVRFTTTTYSQFAIDGLAIRARLDNTTVGLPGDLAVRSESDMFGYPRTLEFLFPNVSPGAHTIRMQFSNSKGNTSHIAERVTIVHHH